MNVVKPLVIFTMATVILGVGIGWFFLFTDPDDTVRKYEPEFEIVEPMLSYSERRLYSRFPDIQNWQRPKGPLKIVLQVGHWKNSELPDELERLRGTSLGTRGGGKEEWEVALVIAQETAKLLEEQSMVVDILPATIPQHYWADVFIAIHADGSPDRSVSGFKVAGPWLDITGKSNSLVELLEEEYANATNISIDEKITHNMRGYYAFNWFRNDHAIHPKTVAAIIETGFLTNWRDQQILINQPERVAKGIANAVIKFLAPTLL